MRALRRIGDDRERRGREDGLVERDRDVRAERFLDAVQANDPSAVFAPYADAVRTDRLTRAVVAATGKPG